jgi:hypothetical protein
MDRRAMSALAVLVVLAVIGRATATIVASNSFEGGLGGWMRGSDAEGSSSFVSGATVVARPAHDGHSSVVLSAERGGTGGAVWLETGVFVDPGLYQVTVSFWVYSSGDAGASSSTMIAGAATGGLDAVSEFVDLGGLESREGWQQFRMMKNVSINRGQTLRLGVGFHRTDPATIKYAIDDISVSIEATPCVADIDGSGSLTAQDVLVFVHRWFAGKPECDLDGSGTIDTLDIFAFLNAWLAGCGTG